MTLIVLACHPVWKEMENLKGNLREFEEICEEIIQNEVSLGGSPTINVTLILIIANLRASLLKKTQDADVAFQNE